MKISKPYLTISILILILGVSIIYYASNFENPVVIKKYEKHGDYHIEYSDGQKYEWDIEPALWDQYEIGEPDPIFTERQLIGACGIALVFTASAMFMLMYMQFKDNSKGGSK